MRRLITTIALMALIGGPAAIAQSGGTSTAVKGQPQGPREAPIGHRQPLASELPPNRERDPSDAWLNRLNRETDRKLEICRAC